METTLADLLRGAVPRLAAAGVDGAARDARLLLAYAAGVDPGRLTLSLPERAAEGVAARFEAALARRINREPLSHILGRRQFWGRWFAVSPAVLDPRPETEVLVDLALREPFDRVLDLGTGTGAILLTLLAERPSATGLGVDVSPAAIDVAAANAAALGLAACAQLAVGNWFAPVAGLFDLIVSNPPYIAASEMADLAPEPAHEPALALTDGADGLSAYHAILAEAPKYLAPGGRLLLEIGPTQGEAVVQIAAGAGWSGITIHPDLDQRSRVVEARMPV